MTALNVTVHVLHDSNLAFTLIFTIFDFQNVEILGLGRVNMVKCVIIFR